MARGLTDDATPPRTGSRHRAGPLILDGSLLSSERTPGLAARAARVLNDRGRPPSLALVAFGDRAGRAAYAARKVRACAAVGVRAVPLVLPFGVATVEACASIERLAAGGVDAVFVEFPFPGGIDPDAVVAAIPPALDVDVMTAPRIRDFMAGDGAPPPLTVAAALALLERYGVDVRGRTSVVVGEATPFSRMFRLAFVRRGVAHCRLVEPAAADLAESVAHAQFALVIAGRPHLLPASAFPAGAVVIDGGYFNAGGRGDIDTASGIDHLAAFAPVPGAIGPMTVSVLIERVIAFAEGWGA